ncbi:O-antigen ligase [Novosphingobium sp. TH158]|uniref:O-antigen ligase family protein n=1 Tax=Novosphingobium sp. TH158 TaxID=2067455 RepID=UPI000C79C569|nr:O-antigen ligase family protein [Novosphingobium sp. TH158]PLK27150.1 hypothetical protein C0V78_09830 [Novosphingobium sp. TH158]
MNLLTRANATLAYLALVLVLGGASAAGFGGNLLLQLLGAGLIAWTIWPRPEGETLHTGLRGFFIALGVLCAVQFLPLPPGLWQHLPGREKVFEGFGLIGAEAPWLTLSLAPWKSLGSFTWWIPALALFMAMRTDDAPLSRHIIAVVTAVAVVSVAISSVQAGAGSLYFYIVTNYGEGPGFFSNSNHQGSFLLVTLALFGSWAIAEIRNNAGQVGKSASIQAIYGGIALLLAFGVIVSGSLACQLLLGPVLLALVLVAKPDFRLPAGAVLLAGLILVAGFAAFLLFGPAANDLTTKGTTAGISRQEFLFTGLRILGDFAPFGSGTGTFLELYRWYEDPKLVGTTYVNHAHNDLLELLIENGVFGLAALGLFLAWYLPRTWTLWGGARRNVVPLAASLAIGTVLVHSLVDYPLRTAAMSALIAIACVLMVRPADPPRSRSRRGSNRPTRHAVHKEMIKI